MAFKDGTKSGGKKKGSRNKSTLARLTAIQEAAKLMANTDGSGVFTGDGHALLVAVYKNEKFPIELRADCAKAAIRYEKPALSAVENTGDIQAYVTRMPAPVASLDEWMKLPPQNSMVKFHGILGVRMLISHRLNSPLKMLRQHRQRKMAARTSELKKRNEKLDTTGALPSSEINPLNFQKGSHPEIFFAAELAGSTKSIIANAAKPHRLKQQSRWKLI